MNPLTNVKNITKLNETELAKGTVDKKSWHDMYKESAWIFVGGLAYGLTEGDILAVFSQYGEIVNINLVRDKKTGKTKGFCFICYANQKSTILAVDNLNGIKLLGRTIRVDHVANYKPPKDNENDDDLTKQLKSEGCAPKPIQLETSPVQTVKTFKKQKAKKEKKKHKKKKRKAEDRELRKKIKQEKKDSGYDKYENLHQEGPSQTRKRKNSESDSSDSESSMSDSNINGFKRTKHVEKDIQKTSHESKRKEFHKNHRKASISRDDEDSESELSDHLNMGEKSKSERVYHENIHRSHSHLNKISADHQYSSSEDSSFENNTSSKSSRRKDETYRDYHHQHHSSSHLSKDKYSSETARRKRKQRQSNSSSDSDSPLPKKSSSQHSKQDNAYFKEKYHTKINQSDSDHCDGESRRSTKVSQHRRRSHSRENDKFYSKSSKNDYNKHYREK